MLPVSSKVINDVIKNLGIIDVSTATIRQIVELSKVLEEVSNDTFIHLELGNPGLIAEAIGVEAECRALKSGIANIYPAINGIPSIKKAGSEFIKAFLDLDVPPKCIIPTVGSMQASYTLMTLLKQRIPGKDSILIFSPGFPAQTHQAKMIGLKCHHLDIYDYREKKLRSKLEEILSNGKFTSMLYSNPNNPSWSNFTEEELEIIGEMATKHDVIVMEDLAYMGMDFRMDFSKPYEKPYIPSVGKYTNNFILLISASKIFSYAGQRIAFVGMSQDVFERKYPALESFYEMPNFGECYIYGVLYTASSGVTHSAQYAMSEMLDKATKGELEFVKHSREYARRCEKIKEAYLNNGFHLVYEKDGENNISDGFFFTVGYQNMTGKELQTELLRYGIATISLFSTGSTKEGIRVCVSMMKENRDFEILNKRLTQFNNDHKETSVGR